MKYIKKVTAVILVFAMAFSVSIAGGSATTVWSADFAVTSPSNGGLMAAGYMDITWESAGNNVKQYQLYIDGSLEASTTSTTYEYYTTKVKSFTVYVTAVFNDGSTASTDTIRFGVTKKGLGLATDMGQKLDTAYMGIGWYYNWGTSKSSGSQYEGIEYVPMIWGGGSMNSSNLNEAKNVDSKYVLGFNEPDLSNQANMSVSTAINYWPQLMDIGKKLGSPATSTWPSTNSWFKNFMKQIDSNSSLDVDFITIHCYPDNWAGSSMAEWFLTDVVDAAYEAYHKPIWITEFSTVGNDVYATGGNGTKEFWETVMPGLDEREYVERYAAFGFNSDKYGLWNYYTGTLTAGGEVYASLGNPDSYSALESSSDNSASSNASVSGTSNASASKVSKIKIKSVKNTGKGKVKVKIKKIKGATGYQIRWSDNKKFCGYWQKKTTKAKYTIKKLEKGSRCFVKARMYVKDSSGSHKGSWSKIKKVKVRK